MRTPDVLRSRIASVALATLLGGCHEGGHGSADGTASAEGEGGDGNDTTAGPPCEEPGEDEPPPLDDRMSPERVLRRATLVLTGTTPTAEAYAEIAALPDDEAKLAYVDAAIEDALQSPAFYEQMVAFGHDWLRISRYAAGAGSPYAGNLSGNLERCGDGPHAGAYVDMRQKDDGICDDVDENGNPISPPVKQLEPWWAPGTMVTMVGWVGSDATTTTDAEGDELDCGNSRGDYYEQFLYPGCSCGPNAVWCFPFGSWAASDPRTEATQVRHPWDEPARLLGHIAWHDRPLSDLVLANYSVGTNMLRALVLRMARRSGSDNAHLDENTTWWRPADDDAPRDPMHPDANDPLAWREFVVATLNPYMLSLTDGDTPSGDIERAYVYDPRTTDEPPLGLPSAGVLTSMGFLSSFERERPRAARALEIFACREFSPPDAAAEFPPFDGDPAKSGSCMNCHIAIDPAARFFKRWDFSPQEFYYVAQPIIPDVGPQWRIDAAQLSGEYPYSANPFVRWAQTWTANTVLTPVTQADIEAHPGAALLDTIPAGEEYEGVASDGTIGPLGFGKILVKSGEFDRCAVSKIYERVVGRPLDRSTEGLYLSALVDVFLANDRRIRPFIRHLMQTDEFRRGL